MTRLVDFFEPGQRVFTPTLSNESALLAQELAQEPDRARDIDFCAVMFPGIDKTDFLGLHPQARQTAYFMSPAVRAGMAQGRARLLTLDYLGIARHLAEAPPVDLAVAQLGPPDADGWCAPGLGCDFMPLIWSRARRRIAHLNPRLPRLRSDFRVHVSELDGWVEKDAPLNDHPGAVASGLETRIGAHVAGLVRDGDTLQLGIGSVPMALAASLANHRRLRFHGGLASSALQTLWEAGAMDADAPIVAGVVLGDSGFRAFAAELEPLRLASVAHTHALAVIAQIPRFIAINSAVEVDLFGQVNAERVNGNLMAGAGGLPAFAMGALASPGGRLVIALAATSRKGEVSRIVSCLGKDAVCTLPRHFADAVVTEHGVAELRSRSIEERAQALIGIAAPEHRDALAQDWDTMRKQL